MNHTREDNMAKGKGLQFEATVFERRSIAIDQNGVPWVIDPDTASIFPAKLEDNGKQSAVVKKK
jgi:hypothetical protein